MFLALAVLNALIGLIALVRPRLGAAVFTVALLAVPSSLAFDELTYRYGLHGHDFFFLVLFAAQALRVGSTGRLPYLREFLLLGVVLAGSALGTVADGRAIDKYVLRDLRPILIVAEALMFFALLDRTRGPVSPRGALWLGIAASASAFFGFSIIAVGAYEVGDTFYQANSFRYLAIGSYIAAVMLVWLAAVGERPFAGMRSLWIGALTVSAGTILLSGSRMLLAATLLGCVVAGRMRPGRIIATSIGTAALAASFAYVSDRLSVARVTDAITFDGLSQQFSLRYAPALERIEEIAWWQWFVGSGMGSTFDIPWFVYRGLDPLSNSVDSTYLTVMVKYGAMSLLYLWLAGKAFGIGRLPGDSSRGVAAFLLLLGITMVLPYQKFAIGLPVACAYFSRVAVSWVATTRRHTPHRPAVALGHTRC
jgi:hypothetical protein